MSQPPGDRRPMPWEDPDPTPPADQPTVVWTPPDAPGSDALPPPAPDTPTAATPPGPDAGAAEPPTTDLWPPTTPATPAAPAAGAVAGWTAPDAGLPAAPVEGFVIAGIGSRLVAWLLDGLIVGLIAVLVGTLLIVVSGLTTAGDAILVSTALSVVILAIDFVYLVGFWTGPRRATPGMRLLALEIVDATSGAALTVRAAVIRWLAFGAFLSLLAALPVIGEISSWVLIGWSVFLLMTTAMSPVNQGIHDRWAGSAVMRRGGASTNGAAIGCLVIAIVVILLFIVLPIALLIAAG